METNVPIAQEKKKYAPQNRNPKPLTPEQVAAAPYGNSRCRLCRLDPADIRQLNYYRFERKWTLNDLRKYIKERHNIGENYNRMSVHFNSHVIDYKMKTVLIEDAEHPEVVKTLQPMLKTEKFINTQDDVTKAFNTLVQMTKTYTERIAKFQDEIEKILEKKDLVAEIKGMSAMQLLHSVARLNKEARDQIKDISALRAPKVLVAQFLESFMNETIKEVGFMLNTLCGNVQLIVVEELRKQGVPEKSLDSSVFTAAFKKVALDYIDKMTHLRRQKLSQATSTLSELEKII